ncbi:Arm DNA-binding domain-containing protein [Sphingomonas bisphenolicum]|uniref:Integrase DNA-binding domain-containing protein n=1 Tax=Sphingomonas bisphenolicum TaxID=296544 RepID=A0ABN5WQT0_9SPHN|nr:hypothetical protein SBA_ch2_5640 [Sphingomonas bisphenolicum]
MSRKKLTPAALDSLAHGAMNDPVTSGLSVKVLSSGKKVWKYMRWVPSKNGFLRRTLGSYPAFSIADARTWANDINRIIDEGEIPETFGIRKIS